jgi:endonuclease G
MKKFYLISILTFLSILSYSQDTIRLKHTNYTTVFSKSKRYPVLVEWWVTKSMVSCLTPLKRKDNFKPDPQLPNETDIAKDYVGSGTDRGHMMPAAENLCQTPEIQDECFYFSNMSAQFHSLNAGDWKSVEIWERDMAKLYDSIHIWCGNLGEIKKIGKVSVPRECWKLVYIKKTNEWFGFLFDNNTNKPTGIHSHEVSKGIIEKETGFRFSSN